MIPAKEIDGELWVKAVDAYHMSDLAHEAGKAVGAATQRNKLAAWMIQFGFATGHGDTIEQLLEELEWQITESWSKVVMASVEAEREACAKVVGEFAQKWWSIHCASNKHMETTRKAHDDFCALQAAIRARGQA